MTNGVTPDQIKLLHAPFPAEAIHWRAQTVGKAKNGGYGALALAYLDARDVMDRLDEICGAENVQVHHYDAGGKMACRIGVLINGQWIWKSDGAGETDIEADKGAFSGALKRAAVHWGIGRYLYDLGNTWVPCEAREGAENKRPKFIKFLDDPWNRVKARHLFLPQQKEAAQ